MKPVANNQDVKEYVDIELDGIEHWDYPDFCDTFVCSATAVLQDGTMREATEEECEKLSDDRELVYDLLWKRLY